jgi:hypothetical protein
MPKKLRKPRKDQELVDLADKIRKGLGDNRPRSFGLYVKLIKEFGAKQVNAAFWKTVRKNADDKIRYFLGVLSHLRSQKKILKQYRALRAPLLKKMSLKPGWREKEKQQRAGARKYKR